MEIVARGDFTGYNECVAAGNDAEGRELRLFAGLRERFSKLGARVGAIEWAMLGLLAAAMGYSLLSVMVEAADRSRDSSLGVALTPDGREAIQLRHVGFDVLDAETGRVVDEVRWIGRWENGFGSSRREVMTRMTYAWYKWSESHGNIEILANQAGDVVAARCRTAGIAWWNRRTGQTRFLAAARTEFLRIAIDEAKGRLYAECSEEIDDPYAKLPPGEEARRVEHLPFDAVRDVRVYELSTGKFLKVIRQLRVGQPVLNEPGIRVFARAGVIEAVRWRDFPDGAPEVIRTFKPEEVYSSLLDPIPHAIGWKNDTLILHQFIEQRDQWQKKATQLSDTRATTTVETFPRLITSIGSLPNMDGLFVVTTPDPFSGDPRLLQIEMEGRITRLRGMFPIPERLTCWSAARISPTRIRVGCIEGTLFDFDLGDEKECRLWRLSLPPGKKIPLDAVVAFVIGSICWIGYAARNRSLWIGQGWLVLLSLLGWPVVLLGIERGFSDAAYRGTIGAAAMGVCFLLLCLCSTGLFLARGRARAAVMGGLILVGMILVCAAFCYLGASVNLSLLFPSTE